MRSAEAAERAGVNVQTLRYYERRGLLSEPARSESGYRAWGAEDVRIVRFVKRAQELGFTLREIDSLLELARGGPESCDAARELALAKAAQLDAKIATLGAMRDSLHQLAETCSRTRARRHCPILDAIGAEQEGGPQ
jgi:Hg(II)-responsive transcriptional regulator